MMHNGVDLQARYENVYSIFPGHVLKWVNRSEYYVKVQTIDYTISFCHLSKIYVQQGHIIGAGTHKALSRNSTVRHPHLTVRNEGESEESTLLF